MSFDFATVFMDLISIIKSTIEFVLNFING